MGKKCIERRIHFHYNQAFIDHWNEQTQEFKDLCINAGAPYGYSGQNIFYTFFFQYWAHEESGEERLEYRHAL